MTTSSLVARSTTSSGGPAGSISLMLPLKIESSRAAGSSGEPISTSRVRAIFRTGSSVRFRESSLKVSPTSGLFQSTTVGGISVPLILNRGGTESAPRNSLSSTSSDSSVGWAPAELSEGAHAPRTTLMPIPRAAVGWGWRSVRVSRPQDHRPAQRLPVSVVLRQEPGVPRDAELRRPLPSREHRSFCRGQVTLSVEAVALSRRSVLEWLFSARMRLRSARRRLWSVLSPCWPEGHFAVEA